MYSLSVYNNNALDRIDKYLSEILGFSRSFIAKLLEHKYIYIHKNNNKFFPKKSYTPARCEEIYISQMDRFMDSGILSESPKIQIDILYQNHIVLSQSDYLIIYKPKGVLSHPNSVRDITTPSISGWLYHNFAQLPKIGNFVRAGLVHRLDKDTDGLMVVVLTEKGLTHFQNLFQSKSLAEEKEKVPFRKFYNARVDLTANGKRFLSEIDLPHIITQEVKPKIPYYPDGVMGITKILGYNQDDLTASIYIEILTGKTHQIRYHLSTNGLPIIGDYLYNNNYNNKNPMQLTAVGLERLDINGEYKTLNLDSAYIG